jgi:hypothetical protein
MIIMNTLWFTGVKSNPYTLGSSAMFTGGASSSGTNVYNYTSHAINPGCTLPAASNGSSACGNYSIGLVRLLVFRHRQTISLMRPIHVRVVAI